MRINKNTQKTLLKIILLATIIYTIFLINTPNTTAAEGCCIYPPSRGCEVSTSQADCTELGGTFSTDSCTQITECTTQGWCCLSEADAYTTQDKCPGVFTATTNTEPNLCTANAIQVKGKVTYSDGKNATTLVNVYLDDVQTGDLIKSAQTSTNNANYTVGLLRGFTFEIKATSIENQSCSASQLITLTDLSNDPEYVDITLPCAEPTAGEVCQQQWTWNWENETGECGQRLNLIQTNPECTSGVPPRPADYVPCIGGSTPECNVNGILETGEQCDPLLSISGTCSDYIDPATGSSYAGGALSCTPGCTISTEGCFSCPTTEAGCTDDSLCGTCAICDSTSLCLDECNADDKITNVEAHAIPNILQKGIGITWETPDMCMTSTITIKRCKADDTNKCTTPQTLVATVPGNSIGYEDVPITGTGKNYCYNLSASVTTGLNTFTIYSDQLACAEVADDICLGQPWDGSSFCTGDVLTSCDENGQEVGPTQCAGGCYGPGGDPTNPTYECKAPNLCETCSGPYGLYPNDYGLNIEPYTSCSETEADYTCYVDDYSNTRTIIGEYKECADVKSCYEYKNEQSCSNNPCDIIAAQNCKWINYTEDKNELGLGVCIPQNPDEQDCTKCSEDGILGNYCPPDICALFGDAGKCYYNENTSSIATDTNTCMNVEDVSCETYDTQTECVGASNEPFTANTIYDETGTNRIYPSTHEVTQNSSDKFSRNKCVWTGTKCVKDSDSNAQINFLSDCIGASNNNKNCLLDFEAPETQLFILDQAFQENQQYSKTQLQYMTATTNEPVDETYYAFSKAIDSEPPFEIWTYDYKYPTSTLQEVQSSIIDELTPGLYKVFYYSEDQHKNLEPVKSKIFELIKDISDIDVTWTKHSKYNEGSDQYLTNLTVNVNYPAQLDCIVNLTQVANPTTRFEGDARKTTPNLEWQYQDLTDGDYNLKVVCADSNMQRYENTFTINIDADTTIKNPSPRGETFRPGEVTLYIETTEDGECYYNNDPNYIPPENPTTNPHVAGSSWRIFSSTGNKIHQTTINAQEEGMHFYYTGCRFPAHNRNYFGNTGDMIYFAIDNSSPQIKLIDTSTNDIYNSSTSKETLSLKMICDDYNELLDNWSSMTYSFGCPSIKYNVYYNDSTYGYGATYTIPSGEIKTFNSPTRYVKTYLNLTLNDTGGNSLQDYSVFLNLRNLSYVPPNVTICDPDNASSCT